MSGKSYNLTREVRLQILYLDEKLDKILLGVFDRNTSKMISRKKLNIKQDKHPNFEDKVYPCIKYNGEPLYLCDFS